VNCLHYRIVLKNFHIVDRVERVKCFLKCVRFSELYSTFYILIFIFNFILRILHGWARVGLRIGRRSRRSEFGLGCNGRSSRAWKVNARRKQKWKQNYTTCRRVKRLRVPRPCRRRTYATSGQEKGVRFVRRVYERRATMTDTQLLPASKQTRMRSRGFSCRIQTKSARYWSEQCVRLTSETKEPTPS